MQHFGSLNLWTSSAGAGGGGGGPYAVNAVTFDGTNDYLTHTSAIMGDSKQLTAYIEFRMDTVKQQWIFNCSDTDTAGQHRFEITLDSGILLRGKNAAGTDILEVQGDNITDTDWHILHISIDTASGVQMYLDNVDTIASTAILTDDTLELSGGGSPKHYVGSREGGGSKLDGDLGRVWIKSGTAIDFTDADNRALFDPSVDFGASGIVAGVTPEIYFEGDEATYASNKGSGAGFTEVGDLTNAATSPSG